MNAMTGCKLEHCSAEKAIRKQSRPPILTINQPKSILRLTYFSLFQHQTIEMIVYLLYDVCRYRVVLKSDLRRRLIVI